VNTTIPCDKEELDKQIVRTQNQYAILSYDEMLKQSPDFTIPPDFPCWGGLLNSKIEFIFKQVRLAKTDIDLTLFPYLGEVGIGIPTSYDDLKSMPVTERAAIARLAAIDEAFYLWVCRTNSHIDIDPIVFLF
jgi:hypothetical protein